MEQSVIPARSVETSPLPGSAREKHISTVCDYTLFSTFNLVCAGFIFVGREALLSRVPRNAGRKDGYFAWGETEPCLTPLPSRAIILGLPVKGDPMLSVKSKQV